VLFGEIARAENGGLEQIVVEAARLHADYSPYNVGMGDLIQFMANHATVTCPLGPRVKTFVGRHVGCHNKIAIYTEPETNFYRMLPNRLQIIFSQASMLLQTVWSTCSLIRQSLQMSLLHSSVRTAPASNLAKTQQRPAHLRIPLLVFGFVIRTFRSLNFTNRTRMLHFTARLSKLAHRLEFSDSILTQPLQSVH
jgi:hypothetical protein